MEIAAILFLIILNGIFAMAEIAIVSSRKTRLQKMANEGNLNAKAALDLANNPNEFLSTVQIGITLIGILAGAFGGATLAQPLAKQLHDISWLAPFSDFIAFTLVVGVITFLSLIIGEIVPKRIALMYPEKIAEYISRPMSYISLLTGPLVSLLSISTNFVLSLFNIKQNYDSQVSDEEVKLLIREGARVGVFEVAEKDIVERTMRMSDKKVNAVMTPRSEIDWIDSDASFRAVRNLIAKTSHAHYPVCKDSLDKVIGIVRTEEILADFLQLEKVDLKKSLHKPVFIPESMPAFKLFELFKKSGIHMALVIDEYGSIQGLITMTDILEEIVGDIPEVDEVSERDIIKRDDNSWFVNGLMPIEEFKEYFHIKKLPGERSGLFQTIGGFLMNKFGKIPVTGDKTEWESYIFEVVDMDENRIDKILVTRI